jgi:hypothetical protein
MRDGHQAYAETGPAGQSPDPEFFYQNSGKQRKSSERTANAPLFSRSPNGWESRISAENEMSLADNLPPKQ